MKQRQTVKDKKSVEEWKEFYGSLMKAAIVDDTESYADRTKRIARLESHPEEWFKYYLSHLMVCEPADFQKRATRRLIEHGRWYEVRAWSRELAKSTRSVFEILYLALTGQIHNVLVVSFSEDSAKRLMLPIKEEFENNLRISNDYGQQPRLGSWEAGEFTTTVGCSFRALGAKQSPRGTRNKTFRPDFILIDDIDTDEECRNPDRITDKWKWIEEALIPTVSIAGNYRILFNGNIIAKYCCITCAMQKAMHVDIINIRDKNGLPSWPQRHSNEDIESLISVLNTSAVQKEYFNNPLSEGDVFKEFTYAKIPPLNKFRFLIAYGDPAPSNSKNAKGSYKSVFLTGFYEEKYYIITGFLDHVTNAEFVEWYYHIRDFVNGKTQVYNYIENNKLQEPFYEQVFIPLFAEKAKTQGFIGIIPDMRQKPDKFSRIEGNLEPLNRLGKLVINEAEKNNPHMQRLVEQFLLLDAQMKAPADGPDCIEGAVWIINFKLTQFRPDSFKFGERTPHSKRF
ncbi:MAG: hypothetical protein LBB90_09895 [Tannerella sp.]|jgi:hypothetical protein|nr:hypothetical protein [Tannerella sp.]